MSKYYTSLGPKILVCCPTRGRPEKFLEMCESAVNTSTNTQMVGIRDGDDPRAHEYDNLSLPDRCQLDITAIRYGPVGTINMIVNKARGFDYFGVMVDDAQFVTPGWDEYLVETIDSFPNKIGIVVTAHNTGEHVEFCYVHKNWVTAVGGWLLLPNVFHFAWNTVMHMIGEATGIVYAPKERFLIHHDYKDHYNEDAIKRDAESFLMWCIGAPGGGYPEIIRNLRNARSA